MFGPSVLKNLDLGKYKKSHAQECTWLQLIYEKVTLL